MKEDGTSAEVWWSSDKRPELALLCPGSVLLKVSSQGVGVCTLVGEGREEGCWDGKRRRRKVETLEQRT